MVCRSRPARKASSIPADSGSRTRSCPTHVSIPAKALFEAMRYARDIIAGFGETVRRSSICALRASAR